MAYTADLRNALSALMLGSAGTTKAMPAARFARLDSSDSLESSNAASVDRRFEIIIGPAKPLTALNGIEPTVLKEHAVTVRVGYLFTTVGDDFAETSGVQGGSGTREAIEDRAGADEADITMVLTWGENCTGLTPTCFDVYRSQDEEARLIFSEQTAILEVPLRARVEVNYQSPGAYVP